MMGNVMGDVIRCAIHGLVFAISNRLLRPFQRRSSGHHVLYDSTENN